MPPDAQKAEVKLRGKKSDEARKVIATEAAQTLQAHESGLISANQESKYQSKSAATNVGGLLDIAMEIAAKRRDILRRLRTALLSCNDPEALNCARQLCGVEL